MYSQYSNRKQEKCVPEVDISVFRLKLVRSHHIVSLFAYRLQRILL
uniref:Macaca fascicularis brain cDNA, clone: QflA-17289 n=1 Tax=Macaca fascicularis TaxID=9541 RepID=I7G5D2_MACFA|nr:unnamed protein product [Macaca fascicularis]